MNTVRRLLPRLGPIALVLGLALVFSTQALAQTAAPAKPAAIQKTPAATPAAATATPAKPAAVKKTPAKPAAAPAKAAPAKSMSLGQILLGPVKKFVGGWLLLIALVFFAVGSLVRLIFFLAGSFKRDKFLWGHFKLKYVLLTWLRFLIPWNQTVRKTPVFTIAMYLFHICIIGLALFVGAHLVGWKRNLGINLTFLELGQWTVRVMTYLTFILFAYLIARRMFNPAVRKLSTGWDFTLLLILLVPFITGYLMFDFGEKWFISGEGDDTLYQYLVLIHIFFADLVLFLIPLTKMCHWVLFFPSRALIGIEWGRRGYAA
jgi:nitrate reductase gamma subunit